MYVMDKQVVILAGGSGTRLSSISGDLPKPMVPVMNKPLLQHIVEQCAKFDFLDVHLLVSYCADFIEEYFGDGSEYGVSIKYHREETQRGTAGALLDVLPELSNQFLVLYGDTYFDVELSKFWDFHIEHGGDASLFLHPNDHPQDSDLVEVDDDFKITAIYGYPHDSSLRRNLVNAAIYMVKSSAITDVVLSTERPDIAKELFPLMLERGKDLYGYLSTEYLKDMGTPERLRGVERDIRSGKVMALKYRTKKKALFLDRDGVINREVDHLSDPDQFELLSGVGEAIRKANRAAVLVVVVTNQPVIARGKLSKDGLRLIHNKMETLLGKEGAYIDHIYYCPHHPDSGFSGEVKALKRVCDCRKPQTGSFLQAAKEMNISLENSWMVGDSTADILAGERAGAQTILVKSGYGGKDEKYDVEPNFIVNDLSSAVDLVLERVRQ
jgi:D,D-heptose 1,7-bisphosphate phosphatase